MVVAYYMHEQQWKACAESFRIRTEGRDKLEWFMVGCRAGTLVMWAVAVASRGAAGRIENSSSVRQLLGLSRRDDGVAPAAAASGFSGRGPRAHNGQALRAHVSIFRVIWRLSARDRFHAPTPSLRPTLRIMCQYERADRVADADADSYLPLSPLVIKWTTLDFRVPHWQDGAKLGCLRCGPRLPSRSPIFESISESIAECDRRRYSAHALGLLPG